MSRAVRRLVFDYQLLWIPLELILVGMLAFMDWGWLFSVRSTAVVQWFVPVFSVFSGMFFVPKMPAWQALPVSPSERRRALWWLWIGLPLIRVILCMALPLVVLTPLRGVHATPAQIAGLWELQLLAVLPMGAIFSASGLLRRQFGLAVGGLLTIPVFVVGAAFSTLQINGRAALILGGVLFLVLLAASQAWTDRIAAAAARFSVRGETRTHAAAGGRVRGWPVLAPYAFSAIVLAVAAVLAIDYSMVTMLGPNAVDHARRGLPSQMIMTAVLLSAIGGQAAPYALRALRALPVGPASLTLVLQGFLLAVVLIPVGALWMVMRATDLDTSQVPVYLAGLIPIVALRLPVNFRIGVQAGTFAAVLPIMGLIFLPFAPWTRSPWFDAAMILTAVLVWIWTWWELARGRAAYRVQPLGLTRWRGGLN